MTALATVPTGDLLRLMKAAADQCVRVVNMPADERHSAGKKGEASPDQAGAFSAVVVLQYARELERRGIRTGVADLV